MKIHFDKEIFNRWLNVLHWKKNCFLYLANGPYHLTNGITIIHKNEKKVD